ncbi:Golgi apparatus protein 1 [Octopus vulgaris]|uniref:Golgi apparatus protein 1 n=1 Tax=Octopus vulgaris TaxID=6645 RepID=A0AA36EVI5_OCTVU|nr:Golgi apparatus protein 1 [Octopus vulgaris]
MAVSVRVHSHVILLLLFMVTMHSNYAFGRKDYGVDIPSVMKRNNIEDSVKKHKIISTVGSPGAHKERKLGPQHVRSARKRPPLKIFESRECKAEVSLYCSKNTYENNIEILECLQNDLKVGEELSKECQHLLWTYKRNLTKDDRFESAGKEVCRKELEMAVDCQNFRRGSGHLIPCLFEHIDNITDSSCKQFLLKMGSIIFSDYRLVSNFVDNCQRDIDKLKCGRVQLEEEDDSPHLQGKTIECLKEKIRTLSDNCHRQIQRVTELQADDYHLDRPLFYACRLDRERFCDKVAAGNGRIFDCLMKHKFENDMSDKCRQKLVLRQQLIAEDIKIEKGFFAACHNDIEQYSCLKDSKGSAVVQRASVMLCLENNMKKGMPISSECTAEVDDMRKAIMEDFQITPEIVINCDVEIRQYCSGGSSKEGKTLHCLMELSRPVHFKGTLKLKKHISQECETQLTNLLHEADVGQDFRIDRALQKACQPVVDVACRSIQPGDARIMSCLMEKLGTDKMTDECEERLIEIQYFISRDFRLDEQVYSHCHKDAVSLCHADKEWYNPRGPNNSPLILPCLYNFIKRDSELQQVSRACKHEIKRVMRQRAHSVNLMPSIQNACLQNLGQYCSFETDKGQEVRCLQDNYEKLSDDCQEAVRTFTEDEDENIELDAILIRACTPMIKKFCEDQLDNDVDPSEVMDCLIEHKHHQDMNRKCGAGVEHHQLILLKDYRFSFKFKESCKRSVAAHCKNKKTKPDVIACLSEHVRNDTLLDEKHRIEKDCRHQLRVELLQRSESLNLDPELKKACELDRKKFCAHKSPGNAQIIECLKEHQPRLSDSCHKVIFKREKADSIDNSIDYTLKVVCKKMIKHYCSNYKSVEILYCLKQHKNDEDFDPNCRQIVIQRQKLQNTDYRLNPQLQQACKMDINKFCYQIIINTKKDQDLEGKVINCLKKQFVHQMLSKNCEYEIQGVIKEAALDYQQDPILAKACHEEITQYCFEDANKKDNAPYEVEDNGKGRISECLKDKLKDGSIKNKMCVKEIARIIYEGSSDIHVDPVLHTACRRDIQIFCQKVQQGMGQQMSCLLSALENKLQLSHQCSERLQQRKEMWEYAAHVAPPESFKDIVAEMHSSPAKYYFLGVIITLIGFIFIAGLTCGRVTKRQRAELKNK